MKSLIPGAEKYPAFEEGCIEDYAPLTITLRRLAEDAAAAARARDRAEVARLAALSMEAAVLLAQWACWSD